MKTLLSVLQRRGHRSQWKYPERREQGRKGGPSYPEVHSSGGESEEEERRSAPRKGGHREMAGRRLRDSRTEDYLMEQLSDIRKVLDTLTHPGQNAPSDFSGRGIDHHEAPARTSQRPHPAPRVSLSPGPTSFCCLNNILQFFYWCTRK